MTQLAYLWGEDAWAIDHAAAGCATELADPGSPPLAAWRVSLDDDADDAGAGSAGRRRARLLDEVASRLATGTLFGDGTLVVLRQPGGLLREQASRDRTLGLLNLLAPGNALCVTDLVGQDAQGPAASGALKDAVEGAGGIVRQFPALDRARMGSWLAARAGELDIRLGPGAAELLAQRVGAHVREGDVDRRRQSELANAELEKLALYRPGGEVTRDDVAELVPEAIPGSMWAFLDAVAMRRAPDASLLATRLQEGGTPMPVLVGQLHRRIRELIQVREHIDTGTRPADLVRVMRLAPFRAQKLAEQAGTWDVDALDRALQGLVELDLRSKGISLTGGAVRMDDTMDALGVQLWIAEHAVADRRGRPATRPVGAARPG
jgi:DNA polymerase III delta subunit